MWFHVHSAPWRVSSLGFGVDFLVALTQQFFAEHVGTVNDGGYVLYDSASVKADSLPSGVTGLAIPMKEIATKHDGRPIMRNIAAKKTAAEKA